ncbi:T9SS type B sorting domain-containing protein [Flavobacterium zhairuonense]|uniref:T9SS type B sorting domain-containing protein n=1 Tax=Flavobacterium zhairuonense TaxID=2493631 RepID=UPI001052C246|nr:T9SS type B sorting domain-containing protein [Flavobacterium zhairuonense]KAF2509312.1 T9SS type B sorting domain-containing protein [Flavobacterium zhairuonense]
MSLCKTLLILFLFSINLYSQNDCGDALAVCGNSGFKGLSLQGFGNIQEIDLKTSCDSFEHNSLWLKISIKTSGTFGFIIKPESNDLNEDFDFFVFGPNASCTSLISPIRCSTTNPNAAKLTTNNTGMTGDYEDLSEGPSFKGDGFIRWIDANAGDSYFVVIDRPIGVSNFSLEWLGTATFDEAPTISTSTATELDISKSDYSSGGNSTINFDLTINSPKIVGNQTNVKVTYHNSSNDAIINANPIKNPTAYKVTTGPETIFVRITNLVTQCYTTSSFILKIDDKVVIPTNKVEICDGNDSDPLDGKTSIFFDQLTKLIFNNDDVSGLEIHYYPTQNDADNNTNELSNLFSNTTPFQQSIFIKASSKLDSAIGEIKINVISPPPVNNIKLTQCDVGENANGLVLFNLNEANVLLTNNNPELETSFYLNKTDAFNGINPLPAAYTNTTNPQTLFARITDSKLKCSSISNLVLEANKIPEKVYSLEIECDADGTEDGIHLFNLIEAKILITTGQELKYYPTENDALLEQNAITDPSVYKNIIPYNDFAFARIEEGNQCFGISKIKLEVSRLPQLAEDTTTNVCDNDVSYFAKLDAGIIDLSTLADFSFSWKKDGNEIPNKKMHNLEVNSTGTYSVTATNKNNCSKTRTIEVIASNTATIKSIDIEDLKIGNSNKVTINVNGKGDYEFSLGDPNTSFQDSNVFDNLKAGIYEVYVNDKKNCGLISKTIAIIGVPQFFTPNNDGYNDYWNILGANDTFNSGAKIFIFDRYGKLIKQITASSDGWDGTFTGSPMPADDYWYTLKLEDGRETKGHFSLKR